MTPNWFSTVALVLWPMVAFFLYQTRPVNQATLWTILGGFLLLPVGATIKFEMVPQFDKVSIPNLAALIGCMLVLRRPPRLWYRFGLPEVLLLMWLVGPFITSELNTDPLVYGPIVLPGETQYDALSAVVAQFIFLIPFFLGRQLLRNSTDNEEILRVLVIAGLIYSLPMLFEIRMSPQLHTWIYGYFPHSFAQQVRDGGFRPVVFLGHGLAVAFFAMTTAVAAAAFWRTRTSILRLPAAGITAYLGAVLILCKSLGSLVYGAVLVPMVRFAKPRLQVRVAMVFAVIVFSYPAASNCRPCSDRDDDECRAIGLRGSCRFPQNSVRSGATALGTRIPPPPVRLGAVWTKSNLRRGRRQGRQHYRRALDHHDGGVRPVRLRGRIWIARVDGLPGCIRSEVYPACTRPGLFGGTGAPRIDQYDRALAQRNAHPVDVAARRRTLGAGGGATQCSLASEFSELESPEQWIP